MCVKIIGEKSEFEFNPFESLEIQTAEATQILVSYDPFDPKIATFVDQMEKMVESGITCKAEIKVKTNNYLNGIKLERQLESIKRKLDVNEVIKGLSNLHATADKKLVELSEICTGKINE